MRTLVAVALATLVACAGTGPNLSTKEGYRLLAQDKPSEALAEFERLKALAPENKEIRLGVGSAHFALAKQALNEKNEETYIAELARAQDEALRAIELDPEFAGAHNLLGIIAAYRSDLDAAQQSFELARRLEPCTAATS
jgi:tetratricopeptide (TPR) repeat protein